MVSKVGITNQPSKERDAWRNAVEGFNNWRVLRNFRTKAEAKTYATECAGRMKAIPLPNETNAPGPWFVFSFEFTKRKEQA